MEKAAVQRNNSFIYVGDLKNATFNFNIMMSSIPFLIGLISLRHVQYLPYLTIFINHLKMGQALKKDKKKVIDVSRTASSYQKIVLSGKEQDK